MTLLLDRPTDVLDRTTDTLDRPVARVRVSDLEALMGFSAAPAPTVTRVRTVGEVKALARGWVLARAGTLPGLVAAHLTGGITSLPDEAPFPPGKDVDLHLVVDPCSPLLAPAAGALFPILEDVVDGVALEAGVKETADYATPEAVLGNPETAVHLRSGEGILFDPLGILRGLVPAVARDYPRREWVLARLAHEREGHAAALGMLPMARAMSGGVGELGILGYATTFLPAALQVASLSPLRIGGRMLVNLREQLAWLGELGLYEAILGTLGARTATAAQAEAFVAEAARLTMRAIEVRVSPHPFQHKLLPQHRDALVEGCRRMIAEGYHREAMVWATPFFGSSTDVLLADGPDAGKPEVLARREAMLRLLDRGTEEARAAHLGTALRLHEELFALAGRIAEAHPGIRD